MYEEWFEKLARDLGIVNVKQTKTYIEIELPMELSKKINGEELFMLAYDISNKFRFSYKLNHNYIILDIVALEKHFLIYLINLLDKVKNELNIKKN